MTKTTTDKDYDYLIGDSVSYVREINGKINYHERVQVLFMSVLESSRFGCKGKVVFCDEVTQEFDFLVDRFPRQKMWGVRELSPENDLDSLRERYGDLTKVAVMLHEKHRQQFAA